MVSTLNTKCRESTLLLFSGGWRLPNATKIVPRVHGQTQLCSAAGPAIDVPLRFNNQVAEGKAEVSDWDAHNMLVR